MLFCGLDCWKWCVFAPLEYFFEMEMNSVGVFAWLSLFWFFIVFVRWLHGMTSYWIGTLPSIRCKGLSLFSFCFLFEEGSSMGGCSLWYVFGGEYWTSWCHSCRHCWEFRIEKNQWRIMWHMRTMPVMITLQLSEFSGGLCVVYGGQCQKASLESLRERAKG